MTWSEAKYITMWPEFNKICWYCSRRFNSRYEGRGNHDTCSPDCARHYSYLKLSEMREHKQKAAALLTIWQLELKQDMSST